MRFWGTLLLQPPRKNILIGLGYKAIARKRAAQAIAAASLPSLSLL